MAATARSQQSIETGTMITRHVLCCSNSLGVELFLNEDTGEQFLRWCNCMPYEMEVAPVLPELAYWQRRILDEFTSRTGKDTSSPVWLLNERDAKAFDVIA